MDDSLTAKCTSAVAAEQGKMITSPSPDLTVCRQFDAIGESTKSLD